METDFKKEVRLFSALLISNAKWAVHPFKKIFVMLRMCYYAWETVKRKSGLPKKNLTDLTLEFQRMFPSKKMYKIISQNDNSTEFAIKSECPLKGTGNLDACHRLMQYDRSMAKSLGGEFKVLESKAISGENFCRVALSKKKNFQI